MPILSSFRLSATFFKFLLDNCVSFRDAPSSDFVHALGPATMIFGPTKGPWGRLLDIVIFVACIWPSLTLGLDHHE